LNSGSTTCRERPTAAPGIAGNRIGCLSKDLTEESGSPEMPAGLSRTRRS